MIHFKVVLHCIWSEVRVKIHHLANRHPIFPAPFVEQTLFLTELLWYPNQLTTYVYVHFQTLFYSILFYMYTDIYIYPDARIKQC